MYILLTANEHNIGAKMKNIKKLVLSASVFTIISFVYNNASYAASDMQSGEVEQQVKINSATQLSDEKVGAGYKTRNIESITTKSVKEKPLSQADKIERFKAMTGKTPQQMFDQMSAANSGTVSASLEKRVKVGATTDVYQGRTTIINGEAKPQYKLANDAISGTRFLNGEMPVTRNVVPQDTATGVATIGTDQQPVKDTTPTTGEVMTNTNSAGTTVTPVKNVTTTTTPVNGITTTPVNTVAIPVKTGGAVTPVATPTPVKSSPAVDTKMPSVTTQMPAVKN